MPLFPSVWELILPNWNIFTIIGIGAIILGILGLVFLSKLDKIFPTNIGGLSAILIIGGIILIWGISMIQDFLGTMGGWIVVLSIAIIFVLYLLLRGKKSKKQIF